MPIDPGDVAWRHRRSFARSWEPEEYGYAFRPYVPLGVRRQQAAVHVAKLRRKGRPIDPVVIEGRKIAATFWGDAWCKNLEAYSDYANRLPRGRSYARNGSVVDLQIGSGRVTALVQGSSLYEIEIAIRSLPKARWRAVVGECSGGIGSLVELLRGSLSEHVMRAVTRPRAGLFPEPAEISMTCSCPDWATLCKHVAASLYGVGARLDKKPELLFTLRGVDPTELVTEAATTRHLVRGTATGARVLDADSVASVFGIEMDGEETAGASSRAVKAPLHTARRAPRPRAKSPALEAAPPQKRLPKDVATLERRLFEHLRAHPGSRMQEIALALGAAARELVLPTTRLLASGKIRKTGVKRATKYSVAKGVTLVRWGPRRPQQKAASARSRRPGS